VCFWSPFDCVYPEGHDNAGELIIDEPIPQGDVAPDGYVDYDTYVFLAMLGISADVLEGLSIQTGTELPNIIGLADLFITVGACHAAGQCYLGSPDSSLPEALVVNKDVLVTLLDLLAGQVLGGTADLITTTFSFSNDSLTFLGVLPNLVSIGLTNEGYYIYNFDGNGNLISWDFFEWFEQ
jgi:hypothetical protein